MQGRGGGLVGVADSARLELSELVLGVGEAARLTLGLPG